MGDHIGIDGPLGCLAVWTGARNTDPMTNPDANEARLRFHSLRDNIGYLRAVRTGSFSADMTGSSASRRLTLFAHGLGYKPLVKGYVTIGGRRLPLRGSVMHRHPTGVDYAYALGADATNVYLNQLRVNGRSSLAYSLSVPWTVYLSNYGVNANGTIRRPAFFDGADINPGAATPYIKAGYFDTLYRYLFKLAGGAILLPRGRTISLGIGWFNSRDCFGIGYRYSVGGHVVQSNGTPLEGYPGNSATFNATIDGGSL